jgi:tetratricopeptide (TPR) repeat protein
LVAAFLAAMLAGAILAPPVLVAEEARSDEDQLRERFKEGYALFEEGQYRKALTIFDSILEADPEARGSLFLSGMSYLQLMEFEPAVAYFDRFLKLEPEHVSGLIGAIKVNQSLGNEEAVRYYRQALLRLKSQQADRRLGVMINYEREIISLGRGMRLSILETFPDVESSVRYQAVQILGKKVIRRLEWILAEGPVRQAVEALYSDHKGKPIYVLAETGGPATSGENDYKMHDVAFESLNYDFARKAFLKVLKANDPLETPPAPKE